MKDNQTICQFLNIRVERDKPFIITHNGKEVYREYHDGYRWKKEYDIKGNLTYYEDSEGLWGKREYDSKGNVIYREDSEGCVNLVFQWRN